MLGEYIRKLTQTIYYLTITLFCAVFYNMMRIITIADSENFSSARVKINQNKVLPNGDSLFNTKRSYSHTDNDRRWWGIFTFGLSTRKVLGVSIMITLSALPRFVILVISCCQRF